MIRLEFPRKHYEESYFKLVQEFSDKNEEIIPASMILNEWENYQEFLIRCENYRKWIKLKEWHVQSTLFFIIDRQNELVWWIELRHKLTEELKFNGWHIWYGIKPSERKRGYASKALNILLKICENIEMWKILINCKKENIWSAKVIQKNGWKWDSDYEVNGFKKERYWIVF